MMCLTAVLFTALGTAVASVLEGMQGFQLIMNFLVLGAFVVVLLATGSYLFSRIQV